MQVHAAGKAVCVLCGGYVINYGSWDCNALMDHLKTVSHVRKVVEQMENFALLGASGTRIYKLASPSVPTATTVHASDRLANMEAMVLAFAAEKDFSFSVTSSVIELAKELVRDPKVLQRLVMHCTMASYKIIHGLGLTYQVFFFTITDKIYMPKWISRQHLKHQSIS